MSEDGQWQFGANMIAHEGGVGIGVIPITDICTESNRM